MGFYDAKGNWCGDGEVFYDAKGYRRSPGDVFYDAKGYLRCPGDGFYDAKGNWVSPGGAFYDGKGYLRSAEVTVTEEEDPGRGIVAAVGILIAIPVVGLWILTMSLVNWAASHVYLVFAGYVILDGIVCLLITRCRGHRGIGAVFRFAGNYLCILSFLYIMLVYAIPYTLSKDGSFGSFVEFTISLALGIGGIVIVQFLNGYHGKAGLEFLLGVLFFALVIVLLRYGTAGTHTIESLSAVYGVEGSKLFAAMFRLVAG